MLTSDHLRSQIQVVSLDWLPVDVGLDDGLSSGDKVGTWNRISHMATDFLRNYLLTFAVHLDCPLATAEIWGEEAVLGTVRPEKERPIW